jgi:hypothetical protein
VNKQVWIFHEAKVHSEPLASLGLKVKTELRSARSRLRAIASSRIDVVYHLPWCLPPERERTDEQEAFGGLEQWLEFGIEALALKQDYPNRVQLWPLDVFIKVNSNVDSEVLPSRSSLKAFVLEQQHPVVFELLEGLELGAQLHGRDPLTRGTSSKLSKKQVDELAELLIQTKSLEQENKKVIKQLEKVQDQVGKQNIDSPKIKELEEANLKFSGELKQSTQEYADLLKQMHQVQEQLERLYLDHQELKQQLTLSVSAMKTAQNTLRMNCLSTSLIKGSS